MYPGVCWCVRAEVRVEQHIRLTKPPPRVESTLVLSTVLKVQCLLQAIGLSNVNPHTPLQHGLDHVTLQVEPEFVV